MPQVYKRAAARRDLIEHYVYLAENADEETADRFLTEAEQTFVELARRPEMGAPLTLRDPRLQGMCKWRVRDFEKFLIFYVPGHAQQIPPLAYAIVAGRRGQRRHAPTSQPNPKKKSEIRDLRLVQVPRKSGIALPFFMVNSRS